MPRKDLQMCQRWSDCGLQGLGRRVGKTYKALGVSGFAFRV